MRPFIIINGKNSNSIEGLVISTLPSITKPAVRTNVEEIDGRDGDIVTRLGYSAYEKEFEIGLSFNYDIDEVISFFNSEGTITFSNEPDKFYRFEALEQIDFEKLVRFRTATVSLHVQPFKFSVVEHTRAFDLDKDIGEIEIRNNGNVFSKPIYTIRGRGNVILSLNGNQVILAMGEDYTSIAIEVEELNAYFKGLGLLANRYVAGDYNNLALKVGKNVLAYQGKVKEITIESYSRWI